MPIALLMGTVALLVTFYLDKFMILRFYNKKRMQMLDGSLATSVVHLLPVAIIFHLGITIYIYGSNDVMYDARWGEGLLVELDLTGSGNSSSDAFAAYENFTASLASSDFFDLVPRVSRLNTVFMVVLLVLVILLVSLKTVLEPLILNLMGACGILKPYQPRGNQSPKHGAAGGTDEREGEAEVGIEQWTK